MGAEEMTNMVDFAGIASMFGFGAFAILIVILISMYKIFEKAGQPGWAGIIPVYNIWVLITVIVGRPKWWFAAPLAAILLGWIPIIGWLISIVTLVFMVIIANDLSKSFGKGSGFTVGLVLLGVVFYPILAFGPAQYLGNPNQQVN